MLDPHLGHQSLPKIAHELDVTIRYNGLWHAMKTDDFPKNKVAICEASSVLLHGIKCAILENRSMTTKMESLFVLVRGSPKTKSIAISDHGRCGIGKGVYKP